MGMSIYYVSVMHARWSN